MSNRMLRADAEIQKELAEIIKNDLSDPRLQSLISVTSVKTSPDFTSAKVRVSIYEQELSKRKEIKALIKEIKKINPAVDDNIFRSIHNVNLASIVGWRDKDSGDKHSYLENW